MSGEIPEDPNDGSISSIILENEILMMKLNAEFGARIFLPENRVAPEVENHFLRSVYEFEKNYATDHNRTTVFEKTGKPEFPPESTLGDEALSLQLDKLLKLMYEHKIVLDTLAEYPDRVLYRFITEEFLPMEVDSPSDTDCYLHFCYEDFYPNHEQDLKQATRYFAGFVIDDISIVPQSGFYTRVRTSSGLLIGYKEAISVVRASCGEFVHLSLRKLEVLCVAILEESAFVEFEVAYTGHLPDGENMLIEGVGQLEFIYSDDIWWVCALRFPGIVI